MRVGSATSAVQRRLVVRIDDWNNRVKDASTRVDPCGFLHCASPYFDTASREAIVTNLIQSLVGLLVSRMCCKHWGIASPYETLNRATSTPLGIATRPMISQWRLAKSRAIQHPFIINSMKALLLLSTFSLSHEATLGSHKARSLKKKSNTRASNWSPINGITPR